MESFWIETAGRKHCAKAFHRFRMDWLRPIERNLPTAQIQPGSLFGCDPADTQIIRKIWTTGNRGADLGDGLQPAEWLLQKCIRRENHHGETNVERFHHAANQAHIVV